MAKTRVREPIQNDWIYSCPHGMSASEIAARLSVIGQPVTELSGRHWREDWQMANDVLRAYGYPNTNLYRPGQKVNWDSLNDWILIKGVEEKGEGGGKGWLFRGESVIIRDSRDAEANSLALLLDVCQVHVYRWQRRRAAARIVVILEDWAQPILKGRIGHRVAWVVNPLPYPGDAV